MKVLTQPPPILPVVACMDHYIVYLYSPSLPIYFHFLGVYFLSLLLQKILCKPQGHFKLCIGCFSFIFRLELDLKIRFCNLDDSMPRLDLNSDDSMNRLRDATETFIMVICMVFPTISMKIMTIAHLRLRVRL